jgi:hypothetical protein
MIMTIQLLYFDGCPSWKAALDNLHKALGSINWTPEIEIIEILDDAQAALYAFQGSPSFKYNGRDLWEQLQDEYHLGCRVYQTPQGLRGVPTVEMLQKRLEEVRQAH